MGLPATILDKPLLVMPARRAALNAIRRNGAYARVPCLPHEDPGEWEDLRQQYLDHYEPTSEPERAVVDELVSLERRRRRCQRAEEALVAQAADEAWHGFPEPLLRLNAELHSQEMDLTIVLKLIEQVARARGAGGDEAAEARLLGFAPILEGIVGRTVVVAGGAVDDILTDISTVYCSRDDALQRSRTVLAAAVEKSMPAIEAARADAAILDQKALARLRQEQTSIARAAERQLRMFDQLRKGSVDFERVVVAERKFHGTSCPAGAKASLVLEAAQGADGDPA